jgi:hypothetical protein
MRDYHWQQKLAGSLRALGCQEELARLFDAAIIARYGRDKANPNFVSWIVGDVEPESLVARAEEAIRKVEPTRPDE